jgi:hypothetical protein
VRSAGWSRRASFSRLTSAQHHTGGFAATVARVLQSRSTTVALVIGAGVAATLIQILVYPALSWNRDEPVYLWQAELLLSGQLTVDDAGFPGLMHPWLSAWRDGVFFSQYPLGWSGLIALGMLVAWPGAAIALAAVLGVSGVCALALEVTDDRKVANLAGLILLASPIFAVQGGLYLNYVFTMGLGLWFVALFVSGVRLRSSARVAAAGAVLGWIVCTRTYDAVLWGTVAGVFVASREWGQWRAHLKLAAWFTLGLAPFVVVLAIHNRALTGSPLSFPITAKDPLDTFGFGQRRLMPSFIPEGYGARRAATSTAKHGFFLPWFFLGAYLGVIVALATAWVRRRDRSTWLLLGIIVVFPLGYFPFWGTYVSSLTVRLSGPIYLVPLYAPLAILVAIGLISLARAKPRATIALVAVLAAITVPVTGGRVGLNRELSRTQIAWQTSLDELDEPAVVVVAATAYLGFINPFSMNDPDPDSDVIFATNAWPTVRHLFTAYPDRSIYLQRATLSAEDLLPSERPRRPEVVLTEMRVESAPVAELVLTITPPTDGEQVWVLIEAAGRPRWRSLTLDSVGRSPLQATWTLVPASAVEVSPTLADDTVVVVPAGEMTVTVGVAFGSTTRRARLTPLVRHRVHIRAMADLVEVVVPGVYSRGRVADELRFPVEWDEVLEAPELQVEVRAERSSNRPT